MIHFIDEVFARTQLHKIYILLSEQSRALLSGVLEEMLDTEGVLRGHVVILGQRQDVTIASVTRHEFASRASNLPIMHRLAPDGWRSAPSRLGTPLPAAIRSVAGVDFTTVDPSTRLQDLGLDSLAKLEIVTVVEDHLKRPVPEELIESLQTVGDVLGWLRFDP